MNHTKQCRVVRLTFTLTDGAYPPMTLFQHMGKLKYFSDTRVPALEAECGQHLYFTTHEKIRANDWYILDDGEFKGELRQLITNTIFTATKVVASTDKALGLPAIPESFMSRYADCNGNIHNVELELISLVDVPTTRLNLTKNNEVIIIH